MVVDHDCLRQQCDQESTTWHMAQNLVKQLETKIQ
jgi:hypothetical protein